MVSGGPVQVREDVFRHVTRRWVPSEHPVALGILFCLSCAMSQSCLGTHCQPTSHRTRKSECLTCWGGPTIMTRRPLWSPCRSTRRLSGDRNAGLRSSSEYDRVVPLVGRKRRLLRLSLFVTPYILQIHGEFTGDQFWQSLLQRAWCSPFGPDG